MSTSNPPAVSAPKPKGEAGTAPTVVATERQQHIVIEAGGCVMRPARLRVFVDQLFECLVEGYYGEVTFIIRDGQIQEAKKSHTIRVKE